jgi:hypothetical protein
MPTKDTPELIEAIRREYAAGTPAETIAATLSAQFGLKLTKNAVIGKAHRNGIKHRSAELARNRPKRGRVPKPDPKGIMRMDGLARVDFRGCQYIAGEPLDGVCGAPVKAGSAYCDHHHGICWETRHAPPVTFRDNPVRAKRPVSYGAIRHFL